MIKQRSLGALIGLSFITCGIYGLIFWIKFSEDMNIVCNGDGESTPSYILPWLLSALTLGIYPMIWYYKIIG